MANGLVLFSNSTDVTGQALADALGFTGSKEWDNTHHDVVVSWGWGGPTGENAAEILKDIQKKAKVIVNNPGSVKANANKHTAFKKMKEAGVPTPDFYTADQVSAALESGELSYPIIGRRKKHHGGKNFYLCLENKALEWALECGCTLFTKYLPKQVEYRIHVMGDKVLQACVKEHQKDPEAGWKNLKSELIKMKAEKKNIKIDEESLKFILDHFVGRDFELPNYIVRSNKLGWKFKFVSEIPSLVEKAAIAACAAVGLNFGAVDVVLTDDNEAAVLEVNSGPGLCDSMLKKYKTAITDFVAPTLAKTEVPVSIPVVTHPAPSVSAPITKASTQQVAELIAKLNPEALEALASVLNNATPTQVQGIGKLLSLAL